MDPQENKNVVNLSTLTLEKEHITLLQRGLKFCPTPGKPNIGDLRDDLYRLHTRLRQIAFFENPEDSYTKTVTIDNLDDSSDNTKSEPFEDRKFRLKSNFKGCHTSQNLEAFIIANENDFNNTKLSNKYYRQNVTSKESKALKTLSENKDIIIRPADKGSAVVIMNRLDYLKEGYKQLSNESFYKHTKENLTNIFEKEISDLIEDMYQNGEIGEKCKEYLSLTQGRTSDLYLLPKIHKNTLVLSIFILFNLQR